jgi:hypothetical protein
MGHRLGLWHWLAMISSVTDEPEMAQMLTRSAKKQRQE